jgi:integrase
MCAAEQFDYTNGLQIPHLRHAVDPSRNHRRDAVRDIRFHDARHTCGTLMHLQNVPIAVISAWLGHASKAFTMATYVHSQPEALSSAAQSFAGVVTDRDNSV